MADSEQESSRFAFQATITKDSMLGLGLGRIGIPHQNKRGTGFPQKRDIANSTSKKFQTPFHALDISLDPESGQTKAGEMTRPTCRPETRVFPQRVH